MSTLSPPPVRSVSSDGSAAAGLLGRRARSRAALAEGHGLGRTDGWVLARLFTDLVAIAVAALVVEAGIVDLPWSGWVVAPAVLMWAGLALGELWASRLRALAGAEARRVGRVGAVATMTVAAAALVAGAPDSRIRDVVGAGLLTAGSLLVGRVGLAGTQAFARRRRGPQRRTLIIGAGRVGRMTAARLLAEPTLGLRPVGFLDKEPLGDGEGPALEVFGASWDLERTIAEQHIETVVVAFSTAPNHVPLAIVRRCWELKVPVILIPRLFEVQGVRTVAEHLGGLPLLTLNPANPRGWQLRMRYAMDRVLAALAILALSPLLITLALAVRLRMGGPVLFRQSRLGRDGAMFDMLKFRTMWGEPRKEGENDAGWAQRAMAAESEQPEEATPAPAQAAKAVDRRTPLGSFMRRWSLDELPQLFNVLRGDMALIGPRPERAHYATEFEKAVYRYRDRARIKPGITGWAQVNGLRGQTSLADRVEWDNFYIENWSPWLDVRILLKTVASALRSGE